MRSEIYHLSVLFDLGADEDDENEDEAESSQEYTLLFLIVGWWGVIFMIFGFS